MAETFVIPANSLYRKIVGWFFWSLARVVCRVCFRGKAFYPERVPATGAVLIAANHQSFLDPPFIGGSITQRWLVSVARSTLFESKFMGWLSSMLNSLPIRDDGVSDTAAIKSVLACLNAQQAVVIFPEGSRTPDGSVYEFKRGVSVLVKRAKCPVVPAAVEGCYDAWPIHGKRPRPFRCPIMVMFGEPIPHEELMKDGPDAAMLRLYREVETMRMHLRGLIREKTKGRYPAPGPGDKSGI